MKDVIYIIVIISLFRIDSQAQNLLNGDLEGTITGYSQLPSSWSAVTNSDPNCLADPGGTSPDLTNQTQPGLPSNGMLGTPYSGNSFVAGTLGGLPSSTFFHEGILQTIGGFSVGQNYTIRLYQSVIKTEYCSDTTGGWTIIVDNNIIGNTPVSVSYEAFNSINNQWDLRIVNFTATNANHSIKFLPYDDDANQIATIGDEGGCLHMGIDSISIKPISVTDISENSILKDLQVYPNPTSGEIFINTSEFETLELLNSEGKILLTSLNKYLDLSDFASGLYFIKISTKKNIVVRKVVKQ